MVSMSRVSVIYSGDLIENRKHVHVEARKGKFRRTAKFWIEPDIELVDSGNFSKKEINELRKIIIEMNIF